MPAGAWIMIGLIAIAAAIAFANRKPRLPPQPRAHPLAGMVFQSAEAFFEYFCKVGPVEIEAQSALPAIVEADETALTARVGLGPAPDGFQVLRIRVASRDGGFVRHASAASPGHYIPVGALVAWMPLRFHEVTGWYGPIVARMAPEYDAEGVKMLATYQ